MHKGLSAIYVDGCVEEFHKVKDMEIAIVLKKFYCFSIILKTDDLQALFFLIVLVRIR